MVNIQDFSGYTPTWCPGCGNWAIGIAIKSALAKLEVPPFDVFASFDIGCSGNMNDFFNAYSMHGLHGRAITSAIGMKIANHKMKAIVVGGDGGLYGEGGNHFIHACRGNHDITVIAHDNRVYGLTTGQVAPTATKGYKSKSTPAGILETPVYPLSLSLTQGATFVAQAFAGDTVTMINLIKEAIDHKGFSLVNILQPCVTFNKINTYKYYIDRVYKLSEDYNNNDFQQAIKESLKVKEEKFPIGILYKEKRACFHEMLSQLTEQTLVEKERFKQTEQLLDDFI